MYTCIHCIKISQ